MALKPEFSIPVALGTGGIAIAVYQRNLPPGVDLRMVDPDSPEFVDAEAARKVSLFTSVGILSGISLIAKDANIFIVGGLVVLAIDWATRQQIFVNPVTKVARTLRREDQMVPTQEMSPDEFGPMLTVA